MATKRKRSTKHRGNAAGVVETRGRTGRKPTASESKTSSRPTRADRFSRPPSWRSSVNRALIAVVVFVGVIIFAFGQNPAAAVALGGFMLLIYVPMGYYMDSYFYRRRQAKLRGEGQ
jgi:hypothetical protein